MDISKLILRPEWDSPSKKIVCLFIFFFISFGLRSQSPGFTISTTAIIVAENASSDTFTIRLNKAPTTNVVLAIQVSDTTEISVSTTTLTFTSTNWSLAQTVTVTGVNDADRDGDIIQDLIVTVVDSMSDDSYDPLADERISVRTQDDDVGICATTPIDLSDFNYVGTATSSGSAEISLTTYTLWKNGAAWYTRRLDLREDFSLNFDLYFGQQGPAQYGADGIAFVIQNIDTGQGSAGEGIGYGGISPSYAIEFDTFQNGYDPADDHIAFIQNGQYNSTSSDTDSKTITNIENVQFHNTIISWDYSESRLSYQFNHSNGTTYTNSKTVDLIGTVLSSDVGYWGFTSATGGFANYHTVRFTSSSTLCLSNEILPPTGSNTQTFCLSDAPTLNDIVLNVETGTDGIPYNLVWFSTSTGSTTYLPLNTPLVDGTTYYAEAANFSDPTFANYRQSATRTSVLVNLIDPGFSVVSPSFSITEGGSTTAIEVSLTDQPSSTVVLDLTSNQSSDVTFSSSSLTFTNSNWNVSQTVTISTVDDIIAEGTEAVTITLSVNEALSDACYDSLADSIFNLNITDNDVAGYLVGTLSGTLQENNPATQSLTVRLTAAPAAAVIIDITNSDATESNLSVSSLTFTAANWNVSQTVSIASVDDSAIDGTQTSSIVFSVNAGSDASFTGLSSTTRTIDTLDDDVAGYLVGTLSGTLQENNPATQSLTVRLTAAPAAAVIIDITNSDATESNLSVSSLTFTAANWNVSQTVSIASVDDSAIDGTQTSSIVFSVNAGSDASFTGLSSTTRTIDTLDDDVAGYLVGTLSGTLQENNPATQSLTVRLTAAPAAAVIIDITNSDATESNLSVSSLTFTAANWNVSQTVSIASVDDSAIDGTQTSSIVFSVNAGSDASFTGLSSTTRTIDTLDDDVAGYLVGTLSGTLQENNPATQSLTVRLTAAPAAAVIIDITNSDATESNLSVSSLTFTAANWNVSQTVSIASVDDSAIDGTQTSSIVFSVNAGSDASFTGLSSTTRTIDTLDDDVAGYLVGTLSGTLQENNPATQSLTVRLTAAPAAAVIIDITNSDATESNLSVSSLTFTAANWNVSQTVSIASVDDSAIDGTQTSSIVFSVNAGSDASFTGLSSTTRTIDTLDDDVAGYLVGTLSGTLQENNPATQSLTVRLTAAPAAAVIIDITNSDATESNLSVSSLTFTAANWNVSQTVSIASVDDSAIDGTQTSSIVFSVNAGSDASFTGLSSTTRTIDTLDDDVAGYLVGTLSGTLQENNPATQSLTVRLTAAPAAAVIIDITNSDATESNLSVSSLTFTAANWNVSQTVSIASVDDSAIDGTQTSSIVFSVNAGSDASFTGLSSTTRTIDTLDDDVAGYLVGTLSGTLQENNPATQSLTVRLTAAPAAAVIIDITNSDATESNLSVSSLTFTAANWNVSQTVSIASVDDSAIDGTQTSSIVFSVNAGSDASFTGLSSTTRTIDTLDDDVVKAVSLPTAGFAISLKDNTTSENGDSGSFEIKLLSKPTDNVSLQLFSSNSNEGTVTSTVTFTPANWSSSQTIYVYGVDDSPPVVDGPILFTIVTSNVLSDDINYSSISGASIMDLNFLNSDNDIASVNVIVFNDNYNTNEKGGTVTLLFELTSKPSLNADIILPLSLGSNTDEAILEVPTMKIVNNNWNQPYSNELIIKGLDDFYVDGDQNYTVIVGNPSSTDPEYDLLTAEDMPTIGLINVDDDVAGFNFNIPNKVSEDGESTTLSVSLTTNVVSSVVLDITVMDQTELSVSTSTLIFNTNNWATNQEIQIFGLDDDEFDGNIISTILLSINNLTTENSYRNVAEAYIAIENSDNDFLSETESNASENPDTSVVSLTAESNEVSEEVVFTELTSDENLSPEEKIKSELKIPNAFSPNGDGTNDGWEIKGIDKYPNNRLEIWNRWGLKVYEKVNYQNDWIGQLNVGFQIGVTNELPQGTYFYRLLVEDRVIFKGFIYLKREE